MKHEVLSQPFNSVLIHCFNKVLTGPHVFIFILILFKVSKKEADHLVPKLKKWVNEAKGNGGECIKVNYNMKCLSEINIK